jgi:5-methylcytosine-specific restriction endonuclease McrA
MSRKHKRSSSWRSTRAIAASTRCAILHRDNFACVYCDKLLPVKGAQLDHLIARKYGGTAIATNLVTSCGSCNIDRAHDRMHPRKVLDAIDKAWRPIDRAIGRELAREHYPSRMNRKRTA